MMFDVIIATYNRPHKALNLSKEILECSILPEKIIIVDSSDVSNAHVFENSKTQYIHTPVKSQPYQRYIGLLKSTSPYIVFLDDDLSIINNEIFEDIMTEYRNDDNVVGVSVGIHYENIITQQISKGSSAEKKFGKLIRLFISNIKPGTMRLFGQTVLLPKENIQTQYLIGPNMSYRKDALNASFNELLFALFEEKLAMGEDKAISIKASSYGILRYIGKKTYLQHPPEESSYFKDAVTFYGKLYYSRLWIADINATVHKISFITTRKAFFILYLGITSLFNTSKFKGFLLCLNYIKKYGLSPQKAKINSVHYKMDNPS